MGILSLFRSLFRRQEAPGQPVEKVISRSGIEPPEQNALGADVLPGATRAPARARAFSNILGAPLITEKSTRRQSEGWYTFRVSPQATKIDIRRAVQEKYRVHVTRVRVSTVQGKLRRRGRIVGQAPGYRKGSVALRAGERIDLQATGA